MSKIKKITLLLLSLFMGGLLVAVVLTFIALGVFNLVPWLLASLLISIPIFINWREKQLFVVWDDKYSVGIESIDNDHRKLFNLINNFQTAIHYRTGEEFEKNALDEVIDYTKYHFKREEDMMEKTDYPGLEAHKKIHLQMVKKIEGFVKDYEENGYEALEDLASFLKRWLVEHINGTDQEYSALFREKGLK